MTVGSIMTDIITIQIVMALPISYAPQGVTGVSRITR